MPTPEEENKIWSAFGLNPQAFPIYYPMGPRPFLDGSGNPSGAAGAVATLQRDLSNFPHMFIGLRISNVYPLPEGANADDVQRYRVLHEWVDGEQNMRIDLAQQNVTGDRVATIHVTGRGGVHWHPFPVPFPMAGGNNINVEIVRLTGYGQLAGEDVLPQCHVTIVAAVLRADLQTMAPHRATPY